jgi:hypothetical protein
MEADFSGWATKAGLKCSDGRVIMPHAFKHQDQVQVPLVWQHGHQDVENVLGHAILENREEGVYTYGYFNDSPKAQHTKTLLNHRDINMMSIWANELIERSGKVLHGMIREVSLVLSGANPGAIIENVTIRHDDGDVLQLEDEVIIRTGLELEHESPSDEVVTHAATDTDDTEVKHASTDDSTDDSEETIEDIYEGMSDKQKEVLHYMLGKAIEATKGELQQDNLGDADETTANTDSNNQEGTTTMAHNVFEGDKKPESLATDSKPVLSHSEIKAIVSDAQRLGSFKDAVSAYALAHGIDDIDILFPEARALGGTPEMLTRRTEWVAQVLGGARKSPFSRIKTFSADLTEDEARAKGYIKGDLKKEEFFSVAKRVTTPVTIYKKQKLDRDDIVDITDFDVVAWLRAEMRAMLDEELARAILIGDGRDIASDDKINQQNIRPIASDHQLYATTVNVNIDDSNSSVTEIIDAIITNRSQYRGTGLPDFYTTETYIAKFMLLKDGVGRRVYKNLDELASELRVGSIVPVEVMESESDLVGILVNMADYVIGADRGGQVSMFDDFDIDYNQQKYLIETRVSGALTKMKSALVVRKVASNAVAVVPASPTFDGDSITIVNTTGVVYKDAADDSVMNAAGSPYAVAAGESGGVYAEPASGYYFESDADTTWTFRNRGT